MKYWIADLNESNGEFDYTTIIRFTADTRENADKIHLFHVGTWYGEDHMKWNSDDDSYWNEYVSVCEGRLTEIDKNTFETLGVHGSLPDMSPKNFKAVEAWYERHRDNLLSSIKGVK